MCEADSVASFRIPQDGPRFLELEDVEPYRWLARLQLDGLSAEALVENGPHYMSGLTIADFFARLAEHWRGWEGVWSWENNEHTVRLDATHDGLGHVGIDVTLQKYAHREWQACGKVHVDAGALAYYARQAAQFDEAQAGTDGRHSSPGIDVGDGPSPMVG